MDIKIVQRWVASVIVFAIGMFPMGAMIGLAVAVHDQGRTGDAALLCVMSGVIGLAMTGGILLIHQRKPYSPLVLLGLIPAIATTFVVF